ncbi:o-succinylbenzoate synthase [Flavobacteriaceae bacterium F89]|uniref:O-succinylbenzoate synthase n=1 Tax=Cerina litoralis TaxID=2874477 RepID=A0AAE3JT88_9FLAO|nr:o-succinylbenzoate synthase [Cerina litoralis]MCG2461282.1 o-succinylbenzoate synthase [Cerina litoralis]
MQANYKKYTLRFRQPSRTSRNVMTHKETWFLILKEDGRYGIGECGLLSGLSVDDVPQYEEKLKWVCSNIHLGVEALWNHLMNFPSIQFGMEQAFLSLKSEEPMLLYPSGFTRNSAPIPINGLIWMGDEAFMQAQIEEKLEQGFRCIKLKIGGLDFMKELTILASIRKKYSKNKIELRLDANGAFAANRALEKLNILSDYDIHSIEQPIKQGNPWTMRVLCAKTPIPIALDEELIGIFGETEKETLLQTIMPQFIILKPSLVGGFQGSQEWIALAKKYRIGWWVTSALESNIGLNAIAQWTHTLNNKMPQGLGTGGLYTNNFDSPLTVQVGKLFYIKNKNWKLDSIIK